MVHGVKIIKHVYSTVTLCVCVCVCVRLSVCLSVCPPSVRPSVEFDEVKWKCMTDKWMRKVINYTHYGEKKTQNVIKQSIHIYISLLYLLVVTVDNFHGHVDRFQEVNIRKHRESGCFNQTETATGTRISEHPLRGSSNSDRQDTNPEELIVSRTASWRI